LLKTNKRFRVEPAVARIYYVLNHAMAASRWIKWIVWSIVAAFAVGAVWLAYGFFAAWHRFASEERICGGFHGVIAALNQFQEKTGFLPTNLTQLVPDYVSQIPAAPIADSIDYRVLPDGTNWQLSVRSSVRGAPELFVQRSSRNFTEEERQQSVTGFHGWLVFRDR